MKRVLLFNAAQSFVAAFDALRHGFRLQPGTLIRGLIENLTTVCHLGQHPGDLAALTQGRLDSTKTLSAAKKIIPVFGQLYGLFSTGFVHVSHGHLGLNPVVRCSRHDGAVRANLSFLRSALWLLYVVTELAFFPHVTTPRYWRRVEHPEGKPAYEYAASATEDEWRMRFLSKWGSAPEVPPG